MEYGKVLGTGTGAVATTAAVKHGYGWFIVGAIVLVVLIIVAVRVFFHRHK